MTKTKQFAQLAQRTGWEILKSKWGYRDALTPLGWCSGRTVEEVLAEFDLLVGNEFKRLNAQDQNGR